MRVLVLSHTTGYQLRAFNDAAEQLGIEIVFATDRCHRLDDPWQDRAVAVRFFDIESSIAAIVRRAQTSPIDGVIAVGDRPVVLAPYAADALGIPWHTPAGALASTDKRRTRQAIAAAGLPSPGFWVLPAADAAPDALRVPQPGFPVVLKPLGLSGSRGVIRADNAGEFAAAFERIRTLLARPQVRAARTGLDDEILVETYVDGREFALEGVMTAGTLHTFTIFDKPDPLEGPFFEETIYVTPSDLPADRQDRIESAVQRAALALGLRHGPIHAECRVTAAGDIYVLEIAARPIGGLCSRVLTFHRDAEPPAHSGAPRPASGAALETVLLQHALGQPIDGYVRERRAAAVMMMPIPGRGIFKGVAGEDDARGVAGVTDLRITAKPGQLLEPLPEAGSYLGFVFARGDSPAAAAASVRRAHASLRFDIGRELTVNSAT